MINLQPERTAINHHVHLEAPFGRVYWDTSRRYLHAEWSTFFEGQALRDVCETVLEAIAEHKARRVLTDSRLQGLISVDDQRWLDQNFMPRLLASGITRLAVVPPVGVIGKMSLAAVVSSLAGTHVAVATVDSVADAVDWLTGP